MKKRITDLLDELPVEVLQEADKKIEKTQSVYNKKTIFAIILIIALLTGCTAFVIKEMPSIFKIYFSDSSSKLEEELYKEIYNYVDYEDYRLAVEGIVADDNLKKILITVTAISNKAKADFSIESCPTPIMIQGSGSGSMSRRMSDSNKYQVQFYYEIVTNVTECKVCLFKGVESVYELYDEEFSSRVNELFDSIMLQKGITKENNGEYATDDNTRRALEDAYIKANDEAVREKVGKILTFSIASKTSKNITIEVDENNSYDNSSFNKLVFNRTSLMIEGTTTDTSENKDSLSELLPTVYIIYEDGTQELLSSGSMGYEGDLKTSADNITSNFQTSWNDTGEFTIQREYVNPIDLDKIKQIKINDIYYYIN